MAKKWGLGSDLFRVQGTQSETYELAYNGGCAAAEKGDFRLALQLLAAARATAEAAAEEQGLSEAERAAELSPIAAQQGYVHQRLGQREEAARCYAQVLEWRGADRAAAAVAAANAVPLQEQQGLFESLKRLERARQPETQEQLGPEQREAVALGHAVLLARLGRTEPCLRALDELARDFPRCAAARVLRAQLLPGRDEALAQLEALAGDEAAGVAAARLHAAAGRLPAALAALRGIRGDWRGEALTLVLALARALPPPEAAAALEEALRRTAGEAEKLQVLGVSAELRAARGDARGAAEDYRLMLQLDPRRSAALAGFVAAASQFDPAAADALAATLPAVPGAGAVDAEELELRLLASAPAAAAAARDPKKSAEAAPAAAAAAAAGAAADGTEKTEEAGEKQQRKRRRHKKKKKARLPKDLDAPVDPERWLPLKQRSYYVAPIKKAVRGKKGRIGGAGGHQGVAVTAEVAASLDAAAKAKVSPPPAKKNVAPGRRKK